MDDPTRTRKTLDDLADLYLTDLTSPPASSPVVSASTDQPGMGHAAAVRRDRADSRFESRRALRLATDKPAPPIPATTAAHPRPEYPSVKQPFGIGASGATQRPEQPNAGVRDIAHTPEPTAQPQLATAYAQAVLLGNLPGYSGPWLVQYARHIASRHGCLVGVLSVDGYDVDIELVDDQNRFLDRDDSNGDTAFLAEPADGSQPLKQILNALAHHPQTPVRAWLVHLPTPIDPMIRTRAFDLQHWTLLCGADDAAVVSAYRLLKQLHAPPHTQAAAEHHPLLPHHVRVMVLGSDEQPCRAAAMKLKHTASSFLSVPIELEGTQKKMQPVHVQPVASFTNAADDPWPTIRDFFNGLRPQPRRRPPHQPMTDHKPTPRAPAHRPYHLQSAKQPVPPPSPASPQGTDRPQPRHHRTGGVAGAEQPGSADALAPSHDQPDAAVGVGSLDLVRFFDGDWLSLPPRCPRHPRVQLALGPQGGIHLLMGDDHTSLNAAHNGSSQEALARMRLRAAIVDLIEARNWVQEHRELLALACPQHRFDPDTEPTLHLFTDQAKPAVTLIHQLGAQVKIHLLQPAGPANWVATELN